jgi:eukaryotic-like serine/threonine-protein kinase
MPPDNLIGKILDERFVVTALLGEGGMGSVYLAQQPELNRTVAVKLLPPTLSQDEKKTRRFMQEAKALSRLQHPNIVTFYHYAVSSEGQCYIAMEHVQGQSLRSLLDRNGVIDWRQTLTIALQVCSAMSYAHRAGIIHRDLKPANIVLTGAEQDQIKIVDFGLAVLESERSAGQKLTTTGEMIGTVGYMSLEQCLGLQVDGRSDIYSLACVLYECLCGRRPYEADNAIATVYKQSHEDPLALENILPTGRVPAGIGKILLKALSRKPAERYQDMDSLAEHLKLVLANREEELPTDLSCKASRADNPLASKIARPAFAALAILCLSALCFVIWRGQIRTQEPIAAITLQSEQKPVPNLELKSWGSIESLANRISENGHDHAAGARLIKSWLTARKGKLSINDEYKAARAAAQMFSLAGDSRQRIETLNEAIESFSRKHVTDYRMLWLLIDRYDANTALNDSEKAGQDVRLIEERLNRTDLTWRDRHEALRVRIAYFLQQGRRDEALKSVQQSAELCTEQTEDEEAQRLALRLILREVNLQTLLKRPDLARAAVKRFRQSYGRLTASQNNGDSSGVLDLQLEVTACSFDLPDLAMLCINHGLSLGDSLPMPFRARLLLDRTHLSLLNCLHTQRSSPIYKPGRISPAGMKVMHQAERDLKEAALLFNQAYKKELVEGKNNGYVDTLSSCRQCLVELAALKMAGGKIAASDLRLNEALNLPPDKGKESTAACIARQLTALAEVWKANKFYGAAKSIYGKSLEIYDTFPNSYDLEKTQLRDSIKECTQKLSSGGEHPG